MYKNLLLIITLTSCASSQDVAQRRKDTVEQKSADQKLKPGMSFEEVKQLMPKMGNCTGSPLGAQKCEAIYLTQEARYWAPSVSESPTEKYTQITLTFNKGQLVKWDTSPKLNQR